MTLPGAVHLHHTAAADMFVHKYEIGETMKNWISHKAIYFWICRRGSRGLKGDNLVSILCYTRQSWAKSNRMFSLTPGRRSLREEKMLKRGKVWMSCLPCICFWLNAQYAENNHCNVCLIVKNSRTWSLNTGQDKFVIDDTLGASVNNINCASISTDDILSQPFFCLCCLSPLSIFCDAVFWSPFRPSSVVSLQTDNL